VSPENIARCEKLTREFREQNQKTLWKEDVLQLRTMMWFAWLSCSRYSRLMEGGGEGEEEEEEGSLVYV
jgi:lysine-specific demethylase 3